MEECHAIHWNSSCFPGRGPRAARVMKNISIFIFYFIFPRSSMKGVLMMVSNDMEKLCTLLVLCDENPLLISGSSCKGQYSATTGQRRIPLANGQWSRALIFRRCSSEGAVEQTPEFPVIWNAVALIFWINNVQWYKTVRNGGLYNNLARLQIGTRVFIYICICFRCVLV